MDWFREVRRTLRGLWARPTFAAVAVGTVALGVGANALVFSVVNAVLLDGLPYPEPHRLVEVGGERTVEPGTPYPLSYLDVRDLARNTPGLEGMVARTGARSFNLLADGEGENVQGELVESAYFPFLGMEPAVGRVLQPEEDLEGEHRVVVLGHGLWTRRFGGDPGVVGRSIELDGRTFEVVGVASPGYRGLTDEADLWLPMTMAAALYGDFYLGARQFRWLGGVARLSPGVSVSQATQALRAQAAELRETYPQANLEIDVQVTPMVDAFFGDVRPRLLLLWGAAGFVLLIAAANLAALLLARGTARTRETSLRAALGATRSHLVGLSLAEGVAISVVGSVVGTVLAAFTVGPVVEGAAAGLPGFVDPSVDGRVVAVMTAVSVVAALVAAAIPALVASRADALSALTHQGRGEGVGRLSMRVLRGFVVAQVAVAVVLVVAVGLTVQGFRRLVGGDLGFQPAGVVSATVDLKAPRFQPDEAYRSFAEELQERATALPGVTQAALVGPQPPVGGWNGAEVSVEDRNALGLDPNGVMVITHSVSPGYFETLGIPLLAGRDFAPTDRGGGEAPLAIVVNESFAQRYLAGSAVGAQVKLARPDQNGPVATVIGVVGDVVDGGPGADARPTDLQIYYSLYQVTPRFPPLLHLMARTGDDDGAASGQVPGVRALTEGWANDVPLFNVRTLNGRIAQQTASQRFLVWLMTGFAALAVGLATVGLYGVMSYTVAQEIREMGVRLALGANPMGIVRMVLSRALVLAAGGVVAGVVMSSLLTGALRANLYGVSALDPATYLVSAVGVLVAAGGAVLIPALRAARTDPARSLLGD